MSFNMRAFLNPFYGFIFLVNTSCVSNDDIFYNIQLNSTGALATVMNETDSTVALQRNAYNYLVIYDRDEREVFSTYIGDTGYTVIERNRSAQFQYTFDTSLYQDESLLYVFPIRVYFCDIENKRLDYLKGNCISERIEFKGNVMSK